MGAVDSLEIDYRFLAPPSALPETLPKRPQEGPLAPYPEPPFNRVWYNKKMRRAFAAALAAIFIFSGVPVMERAVVAPAEAIPVVSSNDGCCGSNMKSCGCSVGANCGGCSGHAMEKQNEPKPEGVLQLTDCPGPASKKLALITGLREIVPPSTRVLENLPPQYLSDKPAVFSFESAAFSPEPPPPRSETA
jgi:hypothetical protein